MAGKNCIINLESKQKIGGDQETIKEGYCGIIMERDDAYYLSYKRNLEDGEVACLLTFDRHSFTMSQKGALRSKLELHPGEKTTNEYSTPVGALDLQVYTRRYDVVEQEDYIKVIIDYDILTGADPIETSMDIEIIYLE